MKTQHTPVPWHTSEGMSFYVFAHGSLAEQAGVEHGPFVCNASTQANAEFIVRACNAHDDMLAALQLINVDKDGDGFVCREAMDEILAVIAQATGKTTP